MERVSAPRTLFGMPWWLLSFCVFCRHAFSQLFSLRTHQCSRVFFRPLPLAQAKQQVKNGLFPRVLYLFSCFRRKDRSTSIAGRSTEMVWCYETFFDKSFNVVENTEMLAWGCRERCGVWYYRTYKLIRIDGKQVWIADTFEIWQQKNV